MGRKARIEYAGARYHLMCRGNRRETIFEDEKDCGLFMETLAEACSRTGWQVCAYVLMPNHYHMVVETPEPNLVAGMKWFQGTYTKRHNFRHLEWGHLLNLSRWSLFPSEIIYRFAFGRDGTNQSLSIPGIAVISERLAITST